MNIYDFTILKNDGKTETLEQYKGNVLLIVNSATACGFTPQYTDLKNLHEKYAEKGLVILDFPCNQFGEQAPGTDEEIQDFCVNKYLLPYTLCAKIDVNGPQEHPLYTYLKSKKGFSGFNPNHEKSSRLSERVAKDDADFKNNENIKWNFTKFLVSKDGEVLERFEPVDDMSEVEAAIAKLL